MATTVLQSPQEKTFYGQNHKTENNLHQLLQKNVMEQSKDLLPCNNELVALYNIVYS